MELVGERIAAWARNPLHRRAAALAASLLVAIAIVWGALVGDERDLTALSVAVALAFGMVASVQTSLFHRRQHTIALLANFSTADALAAADSHVARLLRAGCVIADDLPEEDDRQLITLLDYYEFIARSVVDGHVDSRTVIHLRGPAMAALFAACGPYLAARRQCYGAGLYAASEQFLVRSGLVPAPFGGAPGDRLVDSDPSGGSDQGSTAPGHAAGSGGVPSEP